MPYVFDEAEIEHLAERVAAHLLPALVQCMKDKTRIAVGALQGEHFTVKEVASRFSCSTKLVYRLIEDGHIDCTIVGKNGKRIPRHAVDEIERRGLL